MYKILTSLFLLLLCAARAQDPFAEILNASKGLPSNEVYNIFQDKKGFIWMGTAEGLCRYDGYEYKLYRNKETTSLSGTDIKEDVYGRIWYQTFDGYVYFVERDSLKKLNQTQAPGYYQYSLSSTRLLLARVNSYDLYDLKTLSVIKHINIAPTFPWGSTTRNDTFIVLADNLYEIDGKGKVSNALSSDTLIQETYNGMIPYKKNILLFTQNQPSTKLSIISNKKLQSFAEIKGAISIQSTSFTGEQLWFCTRSGVYAMAEDGKLQNAGLPYFAGSSVSSVLKDREGNYWFSTTNAGVYLVRDYNVRFFKTDFNPLRLAMTETDMIIGTKNEEIICYDPILKKEKKVVYKGNSNKEIYFLKTDTTNNRILFTASGNFNILKESGQQLANYPLAAKDVIPVDDKYYAFAGSSLCGFLYGGENKTSDFDIAFHSSPKTEMDSNIRVLLTYTRGKSAARLPQKKLIFLATSTGLFYWNGKLTEFKKNNESIFLVQLVETENSILGRDTRGNLYLITDSNRIEQVNTEGFFDANARVTLLKSMGRRTLLLAGGSLYEFDTSNKKFISLFSGLENTEVNDFIVNKNELIIASSNGLICSSLHLHDQRKSEPLMVLNSVKVNGKETDLPENSELNYASNNISISYSLLHFSSKNNHPLWYRINNNSWQLTSPASRQLNFASLAPGPYKIEFSFDKNYALPVKLEFSIQKPIWMRWWFFLFILILTAGFLFLFYQNKIRQLQKRNRLLSEKAELERKLNLSVLTSIRSQMNPHFFYNALNTIQSFIYSDDKKNASVYLSKFSKLTRLILEMSEKEKIPLAEEVTALKLYLEIEKVRFQDDFEYRLHVAENVDQEQISIPSMLIQPYVENAIKHGLLHKKGNKILNIRFEIENGNLIVSIEDNGIGRKRSGELNRIKNPGHTSFSTHANERRLEILNHGKEKRTSAEYTDLADETGNASGTRVTITINIY